MAQDADPASFMVLTHFKVTKFIIREVRVLLRLRINHAEPKIELPNYYLRGESNMTSIIDSEIFKQSRKQNLFT